MVIYQNSFTLAATLHTDIHYSKHCVNLALPTLVPVLKFNSPVGNSRCGDSEEELVNSRAPDIAIYFRTYLCAALHVAFIAAV